MISNTDLRNRELKVFLSDVLPALPQRIHPSLGTDSAHFGTRALSHLLCQSTEVDSPLQRHLWESSVSPTTNNNPRHS